VNIRIASVSPALRENRIARWSRSVADGFLTRALHLRNPAMLRVAAVHNAGVSVSDSGEGCE
jgi:hypothetical protein